MAFKQNPFTGRPDYYQGSFQGSFAVAPLNPKDGWMYVNTLNDTLYVYYAGAWQALSTLAGWPYLALEANDLALSEAGDVLLWES